VHGGAWRREEHRNGQGNRGGDGCSLTVVRWTACETLSTPCRELCLWPRLKKSNPITCIVRGPCRPLSWQAACILSRQREVRDGGSQSRALGLGQGDASPEARRSLGHRTIPRRTTARGANPNTSRLRAAILLCSRATACRYAKTLILLCSWQRNGEFPRENPNLCPPHPVLITTSLPDSDRPPDHDAHELHSTRRIESRCKYFKNPTLKG
jgi:hypothetical protein